MIQPILFWRRNVHPLLFFFLPVLYFYSIPAAFTFFGSLIRDRKKYLRIFEKKGLIERFLWGKCWVLTLFQHKSILLRFVNITKSYILSFRCPKASEFMFFKEKTWIKAHQMVDIFAVALRKILTNLYILQQRLYFTTWSHNLWIEK